MAAASAARLGSGIPTTAPILGCHTMECSIARLAGASTLRRSFTQRLITAIAAVSAPSGRATRLLLQQWRRHVEQRLHRQRALAVMASLAARPRTAAVRRRIAAVVVSPVADSTAEEAADAAKIRIS